MALINNIKQIAAIVQERSKNKCEICGEDATELHHIIFGKGKRTQCQTQHSVINLCMNCHRGTHGVHGKYGKDLDLELRELLRSKYEDLGYTEKEINALMGNGIMKGLNLFEE